ncbi:hypothetical protein [Parahaliea mediterranea]|uniref:hypothetical protein n=1 Tax=Parahaliea mediterranea TaxID=651086 RepID=UPI0013008A9B|nr:hypothetical protein [Parahaliea mediterranea]
MNPKAFINYFPEIASLDKDRQEVLLEKARYVSFTDLKLSGKSALYFILSLLVGFTFPITSFLFFGTSILINSLFIGVGCFVSLLLYKRLYSLLLQQGLNEILKSNAT